MVYQILTGKSPVALATLKSDRLTPVDGNFDKIEIADLSQDGGVRVSNTELDVGRAIKPDHVPTRLRRGKQSKLPLADYNNGVKNTRYISAAFKDLIERFEPDVHQFFPLSVEWGGKEIGQLYLFNVCNRIDSLDFEASDPPIKLGDRMFGHADGTPGTPVFSRSKIGNVQIWRDKHDLYHWMSDALHDAIFDAGLTGVKETRRYEETA